MLFSLQIFTRSILTNTSFFNKGKFNFLQIKQDTIRKKCCENMKRDSANAHVHMRRDTSSHHQLRTYLIDGPFLNQKNI